jgi:cytidyltransferase-like protein
MREAAVGMFVGVFDLFNVGHLDVLVTAAGRCDHLVVAVVADDLAAATGRRRPFVPETERGQIVGAVRGVGRVVLVTAADLGPLVRETGAEMVFAPDDEDLADTVVVPDGVRFEPLDGGRVTASAAVRAALGGPTDRSSVA